MAGLKLITVYIYFLSCFFPAQSFALPVDSTSSAGNPLLHPTLELTGTPGNLQSQMSLYHVVDNLLRWLRAQQDIRYHAAVLQTVACQIGGNPPFREPTLSNDVRRFRRCLCVFRYGVQRYLTPIPTGSKWRINGRVIGRDGGLRNLKWWGTDFVGLRGSRLGGE